MIKKILAFSISLGYLAMAMPALAATATTQAQISCVGSAVSVREGSLSSAIASHGQAVVAAYSARTSALQQAYSSGASNTSIKAAVKTAWANFNSAVLAARKTWQTSRTAAWATFRTAVKACKAPAVTTDSEKSNSEASGG